MTTLWMKLLKGIVKDGDRVELSSGSYTIEARDDGGMSLIPVDENDEESRDA